MLFKKLIRTMGLYRAQFISMIIMIALGVGIFVGFNMEWVSIDENTSSFFKETGFADYRISSEKGFQRKRLKALKRFRALKMRRAFFRLTRTLRKKSATERRLP